MNQSGSSGGLQPKKTRWLMWTILAIFGGVLLIGGVAVVAVLLAGDAVSETFIDLETPTTIQVAPPTTWTTEEFQSLVGYCERTTGLGSCGEVIFSMRPFGCTVEAGYLLIDAFDNLKKGENVGGLLTRLRDTGECYAIP